VATTVARLQAVLSADTRDFDRGMDKSQGKMSKVGKAAGIAGLAIAGGLAVGLKKSVHEAMEAEQVQARLAVAFKTAGLNIKPYAKSIEQADKATRKMGFSDEDAKNALGSLIVATKSYKKSRVDLNIAMDIARFKNIDLLSATKMLTMAQAGSQRATKQLGLTVQASTANADKAKLAYNAQKDAIDAQYKSLGKLTPAEEAQKQAALDTAKAHYDGAKATAQVIDKQVTAAKVIDLVKVKLHGQAQAFSETTAGQMARFSAQTQELEEQLGKMLLPALTGVTAALATLAEGMQGHTEIAKIATVALAGLAAALLLTSLYAKLAASAFVKQFIPALVRSTGAMLGFDAAADANPLGAVIVSVVALSAALVYLELKYQALSRAVKFLTTNWYLLLVPIGLIPAAIALVVKKFGLFEDVVGGVQKAAAGLRNEVHTLASAFEKVVDALKWIINNAKKIGGVLGGIGGAIGGAVGKVNPFGDGLGSIQKAVKMGGSGAAEGKAFNVGSQLWDEIGFGEKLGLRVTSGYRPGAVTKHGTPSDHGYNPSRAVDMAGSGGAMAAMFMALVGRREIRQAFYDPLGSIFGGVRSSYREGGHSDHIHIAEYDKGGYLRPGWNLAYNGLGRNEQVGGGDVVIPVSIGGEHVATVIFDQLRRKAKVFENRNGRPAFGGA
jgi:putative effector of murein hydrolase LrgA (UPF0299 family)